MAAEHELGSLPDHSIVMSIFFRMIRVSDTCWVPDPMGMDMRIIFYSCLTPVSDPNRDGYVTGIFFHPRII
jgi:hypothetical protein